VIARLAPCAPGSAGTRLPDPSSPEASLSDFEELQTFEVISDDERSRPVGVSCGLELGFHVFDPLTGESRVHTWPEFAYDKFERL
jgi:hypothetical protein